MSTPSNLPEQKTPAPAPTKPSFSLRLHRWLPRFNAPRDQSGGIQISGNANVQVQGDLFAGDKIVNIGSLVVPVRFLVALLAVALALAVAVWWIVTPGKMPAGGAASNVAIVEFGAQDAQGNVSASAQGAFLANWLYNRLNFELVDLPETARPNIWHLATNLDPLPLAQKRTTAPLRTEADAKRVADQVGAAIVIYGNLVQGQSVESFVPQLYVAQQVGEADELTGSQQLGQPIPLPRDANDEYLAANLQPIGRALVWFSRGLQNDLNGRYDLAYQILKQGEAGLGDWNENQGKEVLYYFIGREALFLANCESDARIIFTPTNGGSAVDLALQNAKANFARAQAIAQRNGRTYARATFGLGQVAFQRAQRLVLEPSATNAGQCRMNLPPPGTALSCPPRAAANTQALDRARTELENARALLEQALQELPQPAPARLEAKIRGARAGADLFAAQLDLLQNNVVGAQAGLKTTLANLNALTRTTPADDRRTLANLYLYLGTAQLLDANAALAQNDVATGKAQLGAARDTYAACVNLIPRDEPDAFLRGNLLPNCSCTRDDVQKILDGLK